MIKKIAWDVFKNTGDINAFMEFKQIENLQNQTGRIMENNQETYKEEKN